MSMNMSRADALQEVDRLASNMPSLESQQSVRIAWWTEFMKFIERLKTADAELGEHAQSVVGRLRGERLGRALLSFNFSATAMETGAQIVQHHSDEIRGALLFISSSLKRGLAKEDDIVTVNGVLINRSNQSVTFGHTSKTYVEEGLPWRMFQRCSSAERGEVPIGAFGIEGNSVTIKDKLNREMNRINKVWKEAEGMRLLSTKGDFLKVAPVPGKGDGE